MNKKTSINIVAIGLVVAIGANVIGGAIDESSPGAGGSLLKFLGIVGGLVYVAGLCFLARAKGRAWAWGLSGLFCLVGGIAVPLLKEKPPLEQ
jgi:hypothetical protein